MKLSDEYVVVDEKGKPLPTGVGGKRYEKVCCCGKSFTGSNSSKLCMSCYRKKARKKQRVRVLKNKKQLYCIICDEPILKESMRYKYCDDCAKSKRKKTPIAK